MEMPVRTLLSMASEYSNQVPHVGDAMLREFIVHGDAELLRVSVERANKQ